MMQVDLQKAYDSIEWPFLFQVLEGLGFPAIFVKWIKACVNTVSYSILINGEASKPFAAKKGVRQGDPLSPYLFVLAMEYLARLMRNMAGNRLFQYHPRCKKIQIVQLAFADDLLLFSKGDITSIKLLYDAFLDFSACSGLTANASKSNIFFGGVSEGEQRNIMQLLGFSKGELPFRYLGVPLSTKKLSVSQCQPLISRITERITSWTNKFLSYAGRVVLIKSVLVAIQTFWSMVFARPKKILRKIDSILRSFLWTSKPEISRKALIAWDTLCLPKSCGGMNFTDLKTWNKAAMGKLFWNLCKKKDSLWIKWVHTYYIKGNSIWNLKTQQASWMVQRILRAANDILKSGFSQSSFVSLANCSISYLYKSFRGTFVKVTWKHVFCQNLGCPKWNFSLLLGLHDRWYTKDRLKKWNVLDEALCSMCINRTETREHLLFDCPFSEAVWTKILTWQGFNRSILPWGEELAWISKVAKPKTGKADVFKVSVAAMIYFIWSERNNRNFTYKKRTPSDIAR